MTEEATEDTGIPTEELRALARGMVSIFGLLRELAGDGAGNPLADTVEEHLGMDPKELPVVTHEVPPYQLVDVQVALEAWTEAAGSRNGHLIGVTGDQRRFHPFSELLSNGQNYGIGIGPVDYVNLADSPESTRSVVRFGVHLLQDGEHRIAILMRGEDPHGPMNSAMIELVGPELAFVHETLDELRRLAVDQSVLRGQVLALGPGDGNQYGALRFMKRPNLTRDQLVLPDETLGHIERHVIGIAVHKQRLAEAGQHLKRGVLLYGPPGTGKTHTVRYLLSQLVDVTAFVLSGQSLALIGMACGMARVLQPSLVILEDVDLIAADRSFGPMGTNPLLFEVLNQIDGLGDDVDVTFMLTTNRVDILERALAERPGRVDAAVEIEAPDANGRARLFSLYGGGLGLSDLSEAELRGAVDATEGKTATYLREVVRRAALAAADMDPDSPLRVDGPLLAEAANSLLSDQAILTRSLLGDTESTGLDDGTPGAMGIPRMMGWHAMGPMGRPGGPPRPFAPDT
jgi:cell division protease FtsH